MPKQRKPNRKKPTTAKRQCSDCKRIEHISIADLYRAARPRCSACGGPLNWLRFVK